MATAKHYEQNGNEKGTRELPAYLFDCEVNDAIMHQAVVRHLANQRQGSASSKERSDVRGGGRKPFRQKGTGRARQGTIRSPLHRGGGVVFGPHPRDYSKAMPKKMRRLALRSALSSRAKDGDIAVIEDISFPAPKTSQFAEILENVGAYLDKVLFVVDKPTPEVVKSARNIPGVRVSTGNTLTTYDVLWADKIVLTESALKLAEEVFKK